MLSISNNSANLIQNNIKRVTIDLAGSIKSVASGQRINSAKDDVSGLAISQRLASELKSNMVSLNNAADTQSFLDTADGAIDEIQKNLLRIRELSVQGKNGTLSITDISALNAEASQRIDEIDRITNSTSWANTKLLDGSVSNEQFQIGSSLGDRFSVSINNISSSALGLTGYSVDMSSGSSSISGTSSHDTLQGDGLNNTITGGVGNDTIIGGGGDDIAVFNGNQADFDIFSGAFTSLHVMGNHSYGVELGFEIVDGDGSVYRVSHSPTNTQTHIVASELANAQFKDASGNNVSGHGFITSLGPNSQAAGTGAAIYIRKSDGSNFSVRRWSGTDSNTKFGFEGRIFDGYSELTTQRLIEGTSNGLKYTTVVGKYNGNIGYLNLDLYGIDRLSQVEWIKFNDGYYEVSSSTFSANPFTPTLASGDAISTIDSALDTISSERGKLGALSNRLDYIIANGSNLNLNLQKSLGNILDTDYSRKIAELTKNQIIQNASLSLLAQANAQKDVLTTLLRKVFL